MIGHPMTGLGVDSHGDFSVSDIQDAVGGYGETDHPAFHEACGDFGTLGEPAIYDTSLYGDDMGRSKNIFSKKRRKSFFATLARSKLTIPSIARAKLNIPSVSASKATVPQVAYPIVTKPSVEQSQVVSTGGQISQQKLNMADNKMKTKMRRLEITRAQSHPMMIFSGAMGEDNEMGFLKKLFEDTKKKAKEEANKLKAKVESDIKARAGEAISKVGSSILQQPKVQSVLAEQAKKSTAQTLAQKLLEPEVQKKAAIGSVAVLATLGGLAYLAFKK